jgi:L-alanine-DL-glutamate epimerase-like enolase superfamily enzyme
MEITDIEAIPIAVNVKPLGKDGGIAPYVTNRRQVETSQRMVIRLETDEGITGWGEMMIEMDPEAMKTLIEREIAPRAIGRSVWEIESFADDFFYYYVDIDSLAGGIEMAMWDALGKQLGAPLHQLLGGKCDDAIPVSYCVGILDPEESRTYARYALEEGFSVLKTKAGRDWEQDIERIAAMDDEVDGQLEFRIDPNQGWTFEQAVRVGAKLEERGVYVQYLEQPIRIET